MRMFDLSGRKALVTGANTGIGQAIAVALAEASAHVVCAGRSPMDETVARIRELGGSASECTLDLAQPTAAAARLTQADTEFGGLDILVNNAGIIRRADALDFSEADWDAVIDINLKAAFFLAQASVAAHGRLARPAAARQDHQHRLDADLPGRYPGAMLHRLEERRARPDQDLACEWAAKGINVNAIAPGYIATANTRRCSADLGRNRQILERIPAGRWGSPQDIGGAAMFLASSGRTTCKARTRGRRRLACALMVKI